MLGRTSIYPALRKLERAGIVEFIGAGARRQIQLRERHPLARHLKQLFGAETERFTRLTRALRDLVAHLPSRPMSAWIDAQVANGHTDETLGLHIVSDPNELDKLTAYLNAHLADVERKYDVAIGVHPLTRSELETRYRTQADNLGTAVLVGGVPPAGLIKRPRSGERTIATHEEHDTRSRRLALAIAAKIRRDPGLIAIAEERIKDRAAKASPGERRELAEWTRLLSTMSPARLQRFLVEDSERATRLRQTLPALNLLSPAERDAIVRSRTDAEVIAAVTRR